MRPDLLALASTLAAREERFALVTVVRREPPSSARVGDTALVTEAGDYHGWAGGGCTRSTVMREALRAMADGEPRLLSLSPDAAAAPRRGMIALPMTCDSGGTVEIYVEPVLPVPRLALFGSAPAVRVLARIGEAMGWRAELIDPESAGISAALEFRRGAHILIASMGERDADAIEAALAAAPPYLGVIASRKRFEQLREELLARGIAREALERIAAPAGLDIGARTPEEIAVSVMAEIVQRRRASSQKDPAAEKIADDKPREAIDPVCGMTVAIAKARHTADVKGVTYYFCCAGCRDAFEKDPHAYHATMEA